MAELKDSLALYYQDHDGDGEKQPQGLMFELAAEKKIDVPKNMQILKICD